MKVPPAKIYFSDQDIAVILEKVRSALATGQLTLGKNGKAFEELFAHYLGTKYAIAVNSGTSAIEIPLRALGVAGKEVIVPTNTFLATALAVIHAGATVRFVDIEPETFSISPESLMRVINAKTAGVVHVHIGGIVSPRIKEIRRICDNNGLFLFEDAAHAHGSSLDGKMAGTFGVAASFSFYPTKLITSGEGGMIVTNSQQINDEAMKYRDQGKASFTTNVHDRLGYNWRMSEVHAAIGMTHFAHLNEFIEERARIAKIYDEGLATVKGIKPLRVPLNGRCNYYKYIALLDEGIDRNVVKQTLREKHGVGLSGEVYELPCHLQPVFTGLYKRGDFPIAENLCSRHVCLPVFQNMTEEQANLVLTSLDDVLSNLT